MKKLLIAAWIVIALDLAILVVMIRALTTAEFSDADREFAVSVTWKFAIWLGAVGIALVVAWWRGSRAGLWFAPIGRALPLLWAWTMLV
ncbi:MAG: hypothetical protein AB7T18_08295 [Alphaproteobacteria bacterium]